MIVTDDIAKAVTDRASAVANLTAALPGLLWYDRGPDVPTAYPYGVFFIEEGDTELFSMSGYLAKFTLRIASYVQMGNASSPGNVARGLMEAFATTGAQVTFGNVSLRGADEKMLACNPKKPDGKYAKELRDGADVFSCGLMVELLAQGNRSVA